MRSSKSSDSRRRTLRAVPERPGVARMGIHVMRDQELRPRRDGTLQRRQPGSHMIRWVDGFPNVVQECREDEFLIVRRAVSRQLEHLQAVVERVAFGVPSGVLLYVGQRLQKHAVDLEAVDVVLQPLDCSFQVQSRLLVAKELLQLGDRRPLDRPAGDRALEDVARLVLGIQRQLEAEAVVDVDVREDPLLVVLDDPFLLERRSEGSAPPGRW